MGELSKSLCEVLVLVIEFGMHLLAKVGCAWMPKGTQAVVITSDQS